MPHDVPYIKNFANSCQEKETIIKFFDFYCNVSTHLNYMTCSYEMSMVISYITIIPVLCVQL